MPLISMTPTRRRRNDMTILSENLGKTEFDTTATVLAVTPVEDQESTQKFLELSGAKELDKQFNEVVKAYENQFKLQSIELQKQSNIVAQDTIIQAGETLGKLSTGAGAAYSEDIGKALDTQQAEAETELVSQFASSIENLQKLYADQLTESFGELTERGFSKIAEYDKMVEDFQLVLLEQMATNVGIKFTDKFDLQKQLQDAGFAKATDVTGEFELTEKGLQQLKAILINPSEEFGGKYSDRIDNLVEAWATKYVEETYPDLDPDSTSYAKKISEAKQVYNEWMQKNMPTAYYTHLNLAKLSNGSLLLEGITYTTEQHSEGMSSSDYTYAANLTPEWFGNYAGSDNEKSKQTKYISGIIADIQAGVMPDGTYFYANYGAAKGGLSTKQLFYYDDGKIYKTSFSLGDLPSEFKADDLFGINYTDVSRNATGRTWFATYAENESFANIVNAQNGTLKSGEYKLGNKYYTYDAQTKQFKKV